MIFCAPRRSSSMECPTPRRVEGRRRKRGSCLSWISRAAFERVVNRHVHSEVFQELLERVDFCWWCLHFHLVLDLLLYVASARCVFPHLRVPKHYLSALELPPRFHSQPSSQWKHVTQLQEQLIFADLPRWFQAVASPHWYCVAAVVATTTL